MKPIIVSLAKVPLGFQIPIIGVFMFVIQFMANYSLNTFFGVTVNPFLALILGLVLDELNFALYVVCFVLHVAGLPLPLYHA